MNRHHRLCTLASSVLLLLAFLVAPGCSDSSKPAFASIDITGANYATSFELTDHNGKLRHLGDFSGKVVVMFFGYTQCPDVCPTTMAELAQVKQALGKDGDRLQGLFVTVDPERDTPQVLKAYMENFDPTFLALYASPEKLVELAKNYKVYFKKVEGSSSTSYTVDHSAGSYVYDAKGRLRLFTRYGSGPKVLAQDIALLLKESS
jgi:protein SCO1/2